MTPEQRINRALWEIERQRTSGEWNLCKVRDFLTGEEPAHLRDPEAPRRTVEEWMMCEPKPQVLELPDGALYTPPTKYTELLATSEGGAHVRSA